PTGVPGSGQMPGEQLAALSAAYDQEIVMFWLGHEFFLLCEPKAMMKHKCLVLCRCAFAGQPGWKLGSARVITTDSSGDQPLCLLCDQRNTAPRVGRRPLR